MIKYITTIVLFLLITQAIVFGQTTRYKDSRGRYTGSSYTYGRNTYYRNNSGNYMGRDYTRGMNTYYYDRAGRNIGRSYGPTKKFPR